MKASETCTQIKIWDVYIGIHGWTMKGDDNKLLNWFILFEQVKN